MHLLCLYLFKYKDAFQMNTLFERLNLLNKQERDEPFGTLMARLRGLANICNLSSGCPATPVQRRSQMWTWPYSWPWWMAWWTWTLRARSSSPWPWSGPPPGSSMRTTMELDVEGFATFCLHYYLTKLSMICFLISHTFSSPVIRVWVWQWN